ncbi:MAG: hypothetical protein JNL28_00885 [Planctomycetes bacterium]|nr:hypothetical protein [Planctomycetota bacterium]
MLPLLLIALVQVPAETPKPIESLPPLAQDAQAVSPDHKRIAVSTQDEGVWVIDIATKTVAFRVAPTKSVVEYVAWTRDSAKLGLLHRNADIEIVDAASGSVTKTLPSTSKNPVARGKRDIHFAAGGTVIVAALGGSQTDIFRCDSGEQIARIGNADGPITTAWALSADESCLALGTEAGVVQMWDPLTGERLGGEARIRNEKRIDNGSDWMGFRGIHSLAFDPSGSILAIGGGDCAAHLWSRTQHRFLGSFSSCTEEVFSTLGIGSVAFSADGSRLVTSSFPYIEIRVWDVRSDELLLHGSVGESSRPMATWFSSDGTRIVSAGGCLSTTFDDRQPVPKSAVSELFSRSLPTMRAPPLGLTWWQHDGDYAWAVVDHHLVVRKIPDEQLVLRIPVREK